MDDIQQDQFELDGNTVTIFPGQPHSPAVYVNVFEESDETLPQQLAQLSAPDCTLIITRVLNWDDYMTPWECPPLFTNGPAYGGRADDHIAWMTNRLIPTVRHHLDDPPAYRCLAGYSLAGLFALYAIHRSGVFTRAASISGSLWYPDFLEYSKTHSLHTRPECLYLSVGDKERNTRNRLMQTVQDRTKELATFYQQAGIPTAFELNPGNHFQDPERRTARGIAWMLSHDEQQ
jgi:predicted alpha/beta superfamily hydrolase